MLTIEDFIKLPRAQLRTAKYKKSVFIGDQYVYKGPYSKESIGFKNNSKFTQALMILEDELQLPIEHRSSLEIIDQINDSCNQSYLVFDNIGKPGNKESAIEKTSKLENKVSIFPRKTLIHRVSDMTTPGDKILQASLQHLYIRYILNIGDSGDHNILVRNRNNSQKLIAGIDLEETRSGNKKYPINSKLQLLFSRRVSKKQIRWYTHIIPKILTFENEKLSNKTINALEKIGINIENVQSKITEFLTTQL